MARRRGAEVVVIWWRDLPTQVNGQSGRDRHQVLLPARFQRAVDRARRKARITTAHDDVAQWRRVSEPCDDHVAAAERVAARLDADYPTDRLGRLAFVGGFEADVERDERDGRHAPDPAALRALEELAAPDDHHPPAAAIPEEGRP